MCHACHASKTVSGSAPVSFEACIRLGIRWVWEPLYMQDDPVGEQPHLHSLQQKSTQRDNDWLEARVVLQKPRMLLGSA